MRVRVLVLGVYVPAVRVRVCVDSPPEGVSICSCMHVIAAAAAQPAFNYQLRHVCARAYVRGCAGARLCTCVRLGCVCARVRVQVDACSV